MQKIETDYLIIGAGACGMAFADMILTQSQADLVIVDRRHRPGGHWLDAYPFVRLHQPSAIYGVDSMTLGADRIDSIGLNAGYYERAGAAEICAYYDELLDRRLLPSGRVRFFGMCDYVGDLTADHCFASRLSGATTQVEVRRRIVDATYLETAVPATAPVSFEVEPGARLVPPGDLVMSAAPAGGYTIIGGGKTAMDCCGWLLEQGVAAEVIRWIRPRDAWVFERSRLQPLDLVIPTIEGAAAGLAAAAKAADSAGLFRRLEACGALHRLDPEVEPGMWRGAILSAAERDSLRRVSNVIRLGRVRRLGAERIELEHGEISTRPDALHVNCTAPGLRSPTPRPIFAPGRITLQSIFFGLTCFNAALIAFIEASERDDAERNRLCPPNPLPNKAFDWIPNRLLSLRVEAAWSQEPDLTAWISSTRLHLRRGLADKQNDARLQRALARIAEYQMTAAANLERLLQVDASAIDSAP
jgi:hypothetical protein